MLLAALFVLGYLAVVFEHPLKLNKAASALLTGVLCWAAYALRDRAGAARQLPHHLADVAGVLFFLLGAMAVVELIDAHGGFELITVGVTARGRRRLLVVLAAATFALSAVLDNLTTAIVMASLVRKLVPGAADRRLYAGVVVIAANAGGVWSPMGDVTTTMLWAGGQVSAGAVVTRLLLPAMVSVAVPLAWIARGLKGELVADGPSAPDGVGAWLARDGAVLPEGEGRTSLTLPLGAAAVDRTLMDLDLRARTGASVLSVARGGRAPAPPDPRAPLQADDLLELGGTAAQIATALGMLLTGEGPKVTTPRERAAVLAVGAAGLLFVPVFKAVTHLPPVLGVLLALGALWAFTDTIHRRKDEAHRGALSAAGALQRVDSPSVLFLLGVLLAVGALEAAGLLRALARALGEAFGRVELLTLVIGLASAVIDNVPLVAAAQGMYPLGSFPIDHRLWVFLTYCTGTGGSILIVGSAAGVAVMGIERISFGWYLRRFSLPALAGYAAGAGVFLAMEWLRS